MARRHGLLARTAQMCEREPMNYRHAFHAGNFADVVKHVVLTRCLIYLQDKPAAFRVLDTHAGAGLYDLAGDEARRGGEWREGIARVLEAPPAGPEAVALLRPYLDIVRAFSPGAELVAYPGSPLIARALLRPQDRLVACEIEPRARRALIGALRRDEQGRVVDLDGWTALGAFVPPKERRGLVLIDPPFEQPDEFDRLADGFATAYGRWPGGVYLMWYPLKDARAAARFASRIAARLAEGNGAADRGKCLRIEIVRDPDPARPGALAGAGLLAVNPPWTLERELALALPALAGPLGGRTPARFRVDVPRP